MIFFKFSLPVTLKCRWILRRDWICKGVSNVNPLTFCSIESSGDDVPPDTKLNDIMYLAELCIDLLHQNEEHHAEVGGRLIWSKIVSIQGNCKQNREEIPNCFSEIKETNHNQQYMKAALSLFNLNA